MFVNASFRLAITLGHYRQNPLIKVGFSVPKKRAFVIFHHTLLYQFAGCLLYSLLLKNAHNFSFEVLYGLSYSVLKQCRKITTSEVPFLRHDWVPTDNPF